MFNHARTLLVNLPGADGYFPDYPGDELIPEDYNSLDLPTYLDVIRMRLFGANPDRAMLNYRAAQLLQVIASTELQSYVTGLDPRLTYTTPQDLARKELFEPKVKRTQGTGQLTLLGSPISPDASGQSLYTFQVEIAGGDVTVQRLSFPAVTFTEPVTLTNSLSQEIDLPYSGYRFRVNTNNPARWAIRGFLRPTFSLSEIAQSLRSIGEPHLLQLFGVTDAEPFLTFRNCWNKHPEFAYQLSGLVLAMIYRVEELRNG